MDCLTGKIGNTTGVGGCLKLMPTGTAGGTTDVGGCLKLMPTGTAVDQGGSDLNGCLKLMPTGTASKEGGGFDWLKGCLAAYSPLPAMIDDSLIKMPTGTVVIGDGFRRLGDWLEAISPSLAGQVVNVFGVLKFMPKGTDAGVMVLGLGDPGNGFR